MDCGEKEFCKVLAKIPLQELSKEAAGDLDLPFITDEMMSAMLS